MLRPQRRATAGAGVGEPARVGRHGFDHGSGAVRTGDDRLKDHELFPQHAKGIRAPAAYSSIIRRSLKYLLTRLQ